MAGPGSPDWLLDSLDADVRLQVASADQDREIFVGIGPEAEVDAYLAGVAHDEITEVRNATAQYRTRSGGTEIAAPGEQEFWAASTSGPGTQELVWEPEAGRWAVAIMNADGSPVVTADAEIAARAGFVVPLIWTTLGVGLVLVAGAVVIIVAAAASERTEPASEPGPPPPPPVGVAADIASDDASEASSARDDTSPVALNASLDPGLSRWQWLVKWFLAIPHFVVLLFLWIAFAAVTVAAGFSILFTGVYPRALFDFNAGVLRWTWQVSYYASTGGIGTDRYPPFRLDQGGTEPSPALPGGGPTKPAGSQPAGTPVPHEETETSETEAPAPDEPSATPETIGTGRA